METLGTLFTGTSIAISIWGYRVVSVDGVGGEAGSGGYW